MFIFVLSFSSWTDRLGQNVAASCRTCCYKVHYIVHWMLLAGNLQPAARKKATRNEAATTVIIITSVAMVACCERDHHKNIVAAVVVQQQPHDSRPKIIQLIPKRTRTRGDSSTRSKSAGWWLLAQRDATDRWMERDGWNFPSAPTLTRRTPRHHHTEKGVTPIRDLN